LYGETESLALRRRANAKPGRPNILRDGQMTEQESPDQREQLEIVELLDERFRLREDPSRSSELQGTHAKLRATLGRPDRGQDNTRGPAVKQSGSDDGAM
jgi:hypothetical protein